MYLRASADRIVRRGRDGLPADATRGGRGDRVVGSITASVPEHRPPPE
ncbi:MAG: hypothetical protein LBE67_02890 [Kocuria palustris]|nr:hypothetical protein [Kocuria palustris]